MRIILLKDTPKIGHRGELKEVSDGYAHNFLIPKGFAAVATAQVQQKVEKEKKEAGEKAEREQKKAEALKTELEKRTFTVKVKVGDKGQIFGGVREKDIVDAINHKMQLELDKQAVVINQPIKALGEHAVSIKLGHGSSVQANTKIKVESL